MGRGERKKGRERSNLREKDQGVGGKVDGWEGQERGQREEEKSRREVGGDTHASWEERQRDGAQADQPEQPGVTETERRRCEGRGTSQGLSPEKEGGQMGRPLAPPGPK